MDALTPACSYLLPSFQHARARDAMRANVLTCDPATTLVTVAQRMASEHVHALVVLSPPSPDGGEAKRRLRAVLTDHDLLRGAGRVEELTAGDVATGELLEVFPDDRLEDVANRMLNHRASHALVIDAAGGGPIGVVSTLDIAGILGWGRG
jgi:CBS domain-containing protein